MPKDNAASPVRRRCRLPKCDASITTSDTLLTTLTTTAAGSSSVVQASAASVRDNFVLSPVSASQSAATEFSTDHAQLTALVSALAAGGHQPVAPTDASGAHFAFDALTEAMQHIWVTIICFELEFSFDRCDKRSR